MDALNVWDRSCSHVSTDLKDGNRENFAEAIRQSEGSADEATEFKWDVMLHLGDISGTQTPPNDEEGREIHRQWSALRKHRCEQIYNVLGNHDESGPVVSGEDRKVQWWFRK